MNIADYIHANASKIPDHTAIYESGNTITYAQLSNKINTVVEELNGVGIQSQQGVAILGYNNSDFIVAVFAVMQLGAVCTSFARSYE